MTQVDGGQMQKDVEFWIHLNIQIIFPTWNYNVYNMQTYSYR